MGKNKRKKRNAIVARAAQIFGMLHKKATGEKIYTTSGLQRHNTSMTPSIPRLKRASGWMSKSRRAHQKALGSPAGIEMHRDLTLAQQITHY